MSNAYWDWTYAQQVYQYMMRLIGNEYGGSGLLGNIYAESNICPFRCEGDNTAPYTTSYNATMNTIRTLSDYDFQHYHLPTSTPSQVGYSLAQWTTYSRKSNYYQYCGQSLLGDGQKSMEFLAIELQNSYPSVWNVLVNATSIRQASNKVLFDFEAPADTSITVQNQRAGYSQQVYDDFSGLPPVPIGTSDLLILRRILKNQHKMVL